MCKNECANRSQLQLLNFSTSCNMMWFTSAVIYRKNLLLFYGAVCPVLVNDTSGKEFDKKCQFVSDLLFKRLPGLFKYVWRFSGHYGINGCKWKRLLEINWKWWEQNLEKKWFILWLISINTVLSAGIFSYLSNIWD